MSGHDFDALVIGAGAVGLACAAALADHGQQVLVLESEGAAGTGVSARNSEVIHAGLYYPTGSLKARLCVAGRRKLYAFLDRYGVDYRRCGKLVVANGADEEAHLAAVLQRGHDNEVEGLAMLSRQLTLAMEPQVQASAAVLSPESGVFDSQAYMRALVGVIEQGGGAVVLESPFIAARILTGGGFAVDVGGADPTRITTRLLIESAGLASQDVASAIEGFPADRIPVRHLGKGIYFRLAGRAPFSRLVYPLPIAGALGTHYRIDLGGQGVFGPDLAYVDYIDYNVDEGRKAAFVDYIAKFWPGVRQAELSPDYAGIRPKIHGPGEPQPDFQILDRGSHGMDGLVTLFGIESPGLTSSLAIGDEVAARLLRS